jgi:uncharacterized RDD family membrane protein YckC
MAPMDEGVKRVIDEAAALDARQRAENAAAQAEQRYRNARGEPNRQGEVAGFWIRLAADALDAVVLFVVGWLLSLPLRAVFEQLGERAVFVGLAISMAYTGILQSRFGGGRTLGKKLLGLRVVRLDGSLMSLDRSLVRYALMGLLVYQGAVAYALVGLLPFLALASVQTVVGGVASVLFLGCVVVVPFHPLKRGLHDLLAGTIVIRGGMPDPVFVAARTDARRDRRIVIAAAALAVIAMVASVVTWHRLAAWPEMKAMLAISGDLRERGVSNVGIQRETVWNNGGPPVTTATATAFVPRPADGGEPDWTTAEARLMEAVKRALPADSSVDRIAVRLRTGFTIGIYKSYETRISVEDARTGQVLETSATWSW